MQGHPAHSGSVAVDRASHLVYTRVMGISKGTPIETHTHRCGICGRATAGIAKHVKACAQRFHREVTRAAAHADEMVTPENGVTDLDLARLLRALDNGVQIHPQGSHRWKAPSGSPLAGRNLSNTVNEALRAKLAFIQATPVSPGVIKLAVRPAVVHMRHPRASRFPACLEVLHPNGGFGGARFRLVDDRSMVDCEACAGRVDQ